MNIQEQFGQIDIYVFDQILRGNIEQRHARARRRVRIQAGTWCTCFAKAARCLRWTRMPRGVDHVRQLAVSLGTGLPAENFRVGSIEEMPFPQGFADVVICNSVLHFARNEKQFRAMLNGLWQALRPGGMLFCRLDRESEWTSSGCGRISSWWEMGRSGSL